MDFVAMTTYPVHVCKFIALHTANVYSAEREMSPRAWTHFMAGCSNWTHYEH